MYTNRCAVDEPVNDLLAIAIWQAFDEGANKHALLK
jgi:hypothetical protein